MHERLLNEDPLTYQIKIMNAKYKVDRILCHVLIEQQIV